MNYKKLALILILLPSVIFGSNNDKRIKELENTLFKIESAIACLRKDTKDLSENKDITDSSDEKENSWMSDVEYNYHITSFIWSIVAPRLESLYTIREKILGKSFYVTASDIAIGTLISFPINYFVINYLLKGIKTKKRGQDKKNSVKIPA